MLFDPVVAVVAGPAPAQSGDAPAQDGDDLAPGVILVLAPAESVARALDDVAGIRGLFRVPGAPPPSMEAAETIHMLVRLDDTFRHHFGCMELPSVRQAVDGICRTVLCFLAIKEVYSMKDLKPWGPQVQRPRLLDFSRVVPKSLSP